MSVGQGERVEITLAFAREAFDLDAIKAAAYRLSDRLSVDIELSEPNIVCTLHPLSAVEDPQTLAHVFRTEVLDQDLRRKIAAETAPLRNLVLSLAFSKVQSES